MKFTYKIFTDHGKQKIQGNKHKIKLDNGETVIVGTNNEYFDGWVATDVKSGLALCSGETEAEAIEKSKNALNWVIAKVGNLEKYREKRLEKINNSIIVKII